MFWLRNKNFFFGADLMYRENIKKYSYQKRNTYTWPIWKEFDTNGHWVDCLSQYDLLRTPRLAIHS